MLQPRLGLKAQTFREEIAARRNRQGEATTRPETGESATLADRQNAWRRMRLNAWSDIADCVLGNASRNADTPATEIMKRLVPLDPLP